MEVREHTPPRLVDANETSSAGESDELLTRLERQAAESGRLEGRVQTLEDALQAERDARRRLAATLRRERKVAEAIHTRAELAEAAVSARDAELEQLRRASAVAQQQNQTLWMQVSDAQRVLEEHARPLWRRLLRR